MNRPSLIIVAIMYLAICCIGSVPRAHLATTSPASKSETFSALAYLPAGAGAGSSANVTITINSYSSPDEVQNLHALLIDRGPGVVLNALEKMKSRGRIEMTGTIRFYDFKVIMSV